MKAAWGNASKIMFVLIGGMLAGSGALADTSYSLKSPDNRIEVQIRVTNKISYDVVLNGKLLMEDSSLSLKIAGKTLGENPQVKSTRKDRADRMLEPVVRQKFAKIRERYNELRLEMEGGYAVVFRAYPEGIAYRIETNLGSENVKVYSEQADFRFAGDYTAFYPEEES